VVRLVSPLISLFTLGSCPPSPAVVVVKKPGGDEMVLDIAADFETVSGIDDEKYVLYISVYHITVIHADFCFHHCQCNALFQIVPFLEFKGEYYQNCSMLCYVQHLCTVVCTQMFF